MKVLLYTELVNLISNSGLGKAIKHQMSALEKNGIAYTLKPRDDYDIAHINTVFLKSYLLAKKTRRKGKAVVYHAHSTQEDFRNSFPFSNALSPLFKRWLIRCYNTSDYIVTPTPYAKRILESYGIRKPIRAVSNGIELSFFKRDEELGKKFRKDFCFDEADKIIVGIGLYIARKGIIDFVELASKMPEYQFVWFGYTPPLLVTRNVKKALKKKLPNLYFPGYVDRGVIRGALCGCDIYLCTTYEETEGIPVLESLAVRQRTLIRDIPIFEDWLVDSHNVYKAKDNDEFEQKIRQILSGEAPDLSEEGYRTVSERDIRKIGLQLKEIYETVLNSRNK